MESLTMKFVLITSTQLFPDKTLGSFINFSLEQLKLEGQWEVAGSERSYTSMY